MNNVLLQGENMDFTDMSTILNHMRQVYINSKTDFIITWSGGKDSSFVLALFWRMLESIPEYLRIHKVHVVTAETGVETPVFTSYVSRGIRTIQRRADKQGLPIHTSICKPQLKSRFFYRVLGRGNTIPTPKSPFRWCTPELKLVPMEKLIEQILASAPLSWGGEQRYQLTLLTGSRNAESSNRKESISKRELGSDSLFGTHDTYSSILLYHPIKFLTADEVFFGLGMMANNQGILPFGVSLSEMELLYGEDMLECGIKVSQSDAKKACGEAGSRTGCWVCGYSGRNDKMLQRMISEGFSEYQYLLEWKRLALDLNHDIRFREVLQRRVYKKIIEQEELYEKNLLELYGEEGRYERFKRVDYPTYSPGGLTVEARRLLLEYLLYIQEQIGTCLIDEEEVQAIIEQWADTDGYIVQRNDLVPLPFYSYDGPLVYKMDKQVNQAETMCKSEVFEIEWGFPMEAPELYAFLSKKKAMTGRSIFYFPSVVDEPNLHEYNPIFPKEDKIIYNKVRFLICEPSVKNQNDALRYLIRWLGWNQRGMKGQDAEVFSSILLFRLMDDCIAKTKSSS
jgi:DNA sulfur modification protein DndC